MTTLVVGASGATGRLLVQQLLQRDETVRAIVRAPEGMPAELQKHPQLSLIQASLLDLRDSEMAEYVQSCRAVASCLGHNMSLKGLFGPPRRLVTDAVRRLCTAIQAHGPAAPVRFVLMNTVGNRNPDQDEPVSLAQRLAVGLLRLTVPPHGDNEQAADYLRSQIGQNHPAIQWAAVRPDSLIQAEEVTPYTLHPSPVYSLFNPGQTSRINVAHFMAELITDPDLWRQWQGQMPVIYNKTQESPKRERL